VARTGTLHYEHFSGEGSGLQPDKEHAFVAVLKDSGLEVTVAARPHLAAGTAGGGGGRALRLRRRPVRHLRGGVVSGEVDHRDKVLTKAERAANTRLLACCSRARGQTITLAL
jgi:hypothetical protein